MDTKKYSVMFENGNEAYVEATHYVVSHKYITFWHNGECFLTTSNIISVELLNENA
tara:strand:+ start:291 stop:458 length:168 start_codon:yes stop_codon:yes gene_type:complete